MRQTIAKMMTSCTVQRSVESCSLSKTRRETPFPGRSRVGVTRVDKSTDTHLLLSRMMFNLFRQLFRKDADDPFDIETNDDDDDDDDEGHDVSWV